MMSKLEWLKLSRELSKEYETYNSDDLSHAAMAIKGVLLSLAVVCKKMAED